MESALGESLALLCFTHARRQLLLQAHVLSHSSQIGTRLRSDLGGGYGYGCGKGEGKGKGKGKGELNKSSEAILRLDWTYP